MREIEGERERENKAAKPTVTATVATTEIATATAATATATATASTALREMHLKFSVAYFAASNYSHVECRSLCARLCMCACVFA